MPPQSGERRRSLRSARSRLIGAPGNHPFLSLRDEWRARRERAAFAARWTSAEDSCRDFVAIATDTPEFDARGVLLAPDERPESDVFPVRNL